MRWFFRLFCALLLALLIVPGYVQAQATDWREQRTARFAILYVEGNQDSAAFYAGFVDTIYDEIAAIFGHAVAVPVRLRLYPTLERYYDVNPLARNLPGVVAHADFRRNEVVVIVPQTRSQTPDEIQNNIRHELTHIVASELSENRLNVNFQEGLAQYIERPSRELDVRMALLRQVVDAGRLARWSDLDDRDAFYGNAEISYPQSLSIVAFLVERYSFARLRDFLTISARSSGYRSALERTYNVSPETLEQEWRTWLPGYLAGGYRHTALAAYDLSRAESLVRDGNYDEAEKELAMVIEWLRRNDRLEALRQAEALLDRVEIGRRADLLATDARLALAGGEYARATTLIAQARQAYGELDDPRQQAVLAEYAERATRGQQAEQALRDARSLAESWRYPQARALADLAANEFNALGAAARADEARSLRTFMDQRQTLAGAVLLLLGIGGVLLSAVRRLTVREAEAW